MGPKGIAASDVQVLSGAVAKAVQMPDVIALLAKNGISPDYRALRPNSPVFSKRIWSDGKAL